MEKNDNVVSKVKEWLTPSLITIIGMFLWRDLSELRQDVKILLNSQKITEYRIEKLEENLSYTKVKENKEENKKISLLISPAILQERFKILAYKKK